MLNNGICLNYFMVYTGKMVVPPEQPNMAWHALGSLRRYARSPGEQRRLANNLYTDLRNYLAGQGRVDDSFRRGLNVMGSEERGHYVGLVVSALRSLAGRALQLDHPHDWNPHANRLEQLALQH